MEKLGTVIKKNGNIAEIMVTRDSACGENCAACGLCGNREMSIKLMVGDDIEVGDKVCLSSEAKGIVGLSAAGYLSLTILLIAGGWIGSAIGCEWFAFGMAIAFVLCGVFLLRLLTRKGAEIKVEKI